MNDASVFNLNPILEKMNGGGRALIPLLTSMALNVAAACSVEAAPPEEGSKQMARMSPFADFVRKMNNKNGSWCCDYSDGRMGDLGYDLKEDIIQDKDGGTHYRVFVKQEIFSIDSHNPNNPEKMINHAYDSVIPPEGKWFDIPRDRVVTMENALKSCPLDSSSCNPPAANILWLSTSGTVYCYWPIQHWGENKKEDKKFTRPITGTASGRSLASLALQ